MKARQPTQAEAHYWQQVRRITWQLFGIWVFLILGVVVVVPRLGLSIYGVPLSYWMISSVLLLSFLCLVACYAWRMDRLESKFKRAVENSRHATGDTDEKQHWGSGPPLH
jgi:putative solute:sodium symporter small subunit